MWCGCLHLKIITNLIPSQANTPHMHFCTRDVPCMGHYAPPATPGTSVENSSVCKFNLCYQQTEQHGSILVLNISYGPVSLSQNPSQVNFQLLTDSNLYQLSIEPFLLTLTYKGRSITCHAQYFQSFKCIQLRLILYL